MRARRTLSVPLSLFSLLLAGCGGSDDNGCSTDTALHRNADYTGRVQRRLHAERHRDRQGAQVSAASSTFGGSVTGTALDTSNARGNGQTYVELRYALADARTGDFSVRRTSNGAINDTYALTDPPAGSLVIRRTILTAN